ncbi:hypothetical protein HDZ31DRAFT_40347 [Schizophyllum fasciatum]
MAASFAAYASQFLTRQPQQASIASSQPLFFSFTTDGGGELDDMDDPHLRGAGSSTRHDRSGDAARYSRTEDPISDDDEDDEGPYLRLDEETKPAGATVAAAALTYVHVLALRYAVRPVLAATEAFVPAALTICAIWAFAGSFVAEEGVEQTWGETVGLRLFALIPLILAIITGRRLLRGLPRRLHAASATLQLVTDVLFGELARPFVAGGEPFLLALSPALLLAALLASIPFATVVFRLLLVGYFRKEDAGEYVWNIRGWARWALVGASAAWLWTWAVARGILRMSAAGVVGAWYFASVDAPRPRPMDTHTIHAALFRATHTSLGTVCLAGAIISSLRALALVTAFLSRLPPWLTLGAMSTHPIANILKPVALMLASGVAWAVRWLETVGEGVGGDALVYAGLTGEPFWKAAGRSAALAGPVGSTSGPSGGQPLQERGWGWARRQRRNGFGDAPLALLTLAPLTLCLPFALGAYIFTAHTLGAPNEAFGAAILVGSVAGLVGRFCIGVVIDCADTLYLCYCIDKDAGQRRRPEVFSLFETLEREPRPEAPARQRPEEAQLFLGGQRAGPPSKRPRHEPQLFGVGQGLASAMQEEHLFGPQDMARDQGTVRDAPRTHRAHPSQGSTRAPLPLEGSGNPRGASLGRAQSPSVDGEPEDEGMEPVEGYDLRSTGRFEGAGPARPAEAEEDVDPFHHSFHDEMPGEIGGSGSGSGTAGRSTLDASRHTLEASRRMSGSGLAGSAQQKMSASRASMSDASVDDEPGSQFFPGSGFF